MGFTVNFEYLLTKKKMRVLATNDYQYQNILTRMIRNTCKQDEEDKKYENSILKYRLCGPGSTIFES